MTYGRSTVGRWIAVRIKRITSPASAASAGAIGTFLSVVNVLVGLAFQAVLAATLGVDALADVFQIGWTIVTFVAVVQFTMVTSLFVPNLQAVLDGALTVGRSRLPVIVGAIACLVQLIAAIPFAAGDLRVLLLASAPAHLFVGATAVPQSVAYIHRRFWIAGAGPVANGLALLSVALLKLHEISPLLLGLAITLGYAAQWGVTALGIRDLATSANRAISVPGKLFVGVLAFTLISKFQPVLERIISYQLGTGTTAALGYGQKVAQGLVLFAAFGIATASTASLARLLQLGKIEEAADLLARITLTTLAFGSTVVALALPFAYPTVVFLFERGAFTSADSMFVTNVVIFQLPWVLLSAITAVLTMYLYIERQFVKVLIASFAGLAGTLTAGLSLSQIVPKYAVAIAGSVGAFTSLLVVVAIFLRTELWPSYRAQIIKRRPLALAAIMLLSVSALAFIVMRTVLPDPGVLECALTTALVALFNVLLVLLHRSVRTSLSESLNAKL